MSRLVFSFWLVAIVTFNVFTTGTVFTAPLTAGFAAKAEPEDVDPDPDGLTAAAVAKGACELTVTKRPR